MPIGGASAGEGLLCSLGSRLVFKDQGSGYPLRVSKVTLKKTGLVKILIKGQLGSNLMKELAKRVQKAWGHDNTKGPYSFAQTPRNCLL